MAEGGLLPVLRRVPVYRRYFGVELAADGNPVDPEALAQVADSNAVVRIKDLVPERSGAGSEACLERAEPVAQVGPG